MKRVGLALGGLSVALPLVAEVHPDLHAFVWRGGAAFILIVGILVYTVGVVLAWRRQR